MASWKWEKSLFHVTLHENGCLCGWWVRIWIGAGSEPFAIGAGSGPLVLKNAWICFRTSFSWVGNSPSLQTHLFCENLRKCHQTRDSTNGLFSAVLMRHDLHVADCSYLPWNEAYKDSLPVSSLLLLMRSWEGMPNERHFWAESFIKQGFCSKMLCLHCFMLPICWL